MSNRNTIQRALVLEAVKELRNHNTADEIFEVILKKHPDISRGTVYRNLNLLAENGKILKIEMPNGAARYDHKNHKHYHAKCEKCGEVFDVEMDVIVDLEEKIKETKGFEFTGHDIIFKGVCCECGRLAGGTV